MGRKNEIPDEKTSHAGCLQDREALLRKLCCTLRKDMEVRSAVEMQTGEKTLPASALPPTEEGSDEKDMETEQEITEKTGPDLENVLDILWEVLILYQKEPFYTVKGLEFTYYIKGNELFVNRKDKSITRASVNVALKKAIDLNLVVSGPKKLTSFGASYLYPVFLKLGIIQKASSVW